MSPRNERMCRSCLVEYLCKVRCEMLRANRHLPISLIGVTAVTVSSYEVVTLTRRSHWRAERVLAARSIVLPCIQDGPLRCGGRSSARRHRPISVEPGDNAAGGSAAHGHRPGNNWAW